MSSPKAEIYFLICKAAGLGLMFALWLTEGGTGGFFLLLFLALMSIFRWRFPKLKATVLIDAAVCILFSAYWEYTHYALILVLFEGIYRRFYWVGILLVYSFISPDQLGWRFAVSVVLGGLCGLFLGNWEQAFQQKFNLRDIEAEKFYELEHLRDDLASTLAQVEQMTAVTERARIARDLHDNAGHEIVAAYISLQTVRPLLETEEADTLELYDTALRRLQSGVDKIRETAHNLQTVTSVGVESLLETCQNFPACPVNFRTYGDTARVPVYVWTVLESCLNESLTNVVRHAVASRVSVELDVTRHIVRLCIENDGAAPSRSGMGTGLRNLRQRTIAIGGSLAVDAGEVFRVTCVIPLQEENHEIIDR